MARRLLLGLALISGVLAAQQPSPPQVRGAVPFLEGRDVPALVVHFSNISDVGLTSLSLAIQTPTGRLRKSWNTDGALPPGGENTVSLPTGGAVSPLPVTITSAVFADGTVVGEPAEVAQIQTQSTLLADDLSAWLEALTVMARTPPLEALQFLRATMNLKGRANDPSGMRRFFESWLREERTPAAISAMLDVQLKNLAGRLSSVEPVARAVRQPARSRPLSSLIRLDTTPGTTREYVVKLRNDRTVPLEAWGATIAEARTGRRLRSIGRDAGLDLESDVPAGAMPGGVLDIGTYQPDADVAGSLTVYLEYAMWKDLEFQGWGFHHDSLLTGRERRAAEYAFFIGPLLDAATLPAPKAIALLQSKQQAHQNGPFGRESRGLQIQLAEWERVAATKPGALAEQLKAYAAALERGRTSLLRHRK